MSRRPTIKTIPNWPGYGASKDGRIWSKWIKSAGPYPKQSDWHELKGYKHNEYWRVRLHAPGKDRKCFVHELILEVFVGPCPDGMECRHLDGVPSNNSLANLQWGTHAENMEDMIRHGTSKRRKLTWSQVKEIRKRRADGETLAEIAQDYPVCHITIFSIVRNKTWKEER